MADRRWVDVGNASELGSKPVARVEAEGLTLALSFAGGTFAAIGATCVHEGGPLDEGTLNDDGCIVCPWHEWQYDRVTGRVPGGSECVVAYEVEVRDGRVRVDVARVQRDLGFGWAGEGQGEAGQVTGRYRRRPARPA